jgi:dGTPase
VGPASRCNGSAGFTPAADGLADYAQPRISTRGRRYAEEEHRYRSPYQRDRDRIVHSRAFRRLEYKTQVFVNHEGDHYRTRLTHSIEVALIGRTVAGALRLNEALVECLALSHDLGHTPFGHLGEDVLDELLAGRGGFNHNRQTLRIVEHLEDRYLEFPGLNLTWEVREGIAKHSGPIDVDAAPEHSEYEPGLQPPVEAQLIDLVDEIAYNHHDLDDGLEAGLIDDEDLAAAVELFGGPLSEARRRASRASARQTRSMALRSLIDTLVTDLIDTTRANIERTGVTSVEDVRRATEPLVGLSPEIQTGARQLKRYLHRHLYQHHRIERMKDKARRMLIALYGRYHENPRVMPDEFRTRAAETGLERTIADYIAGMTDRYAIQEYRRLFDPAVRA